MVNSFKNAVRTIQRQLRANLSPIIQAESAELITNQIKTLTSYQYAKKIALYRAVNGEVSLEKLWHEASGEKICYFPSINKKNTLSFLPATPATIFIANNYNIQEPQVDFTEEIALENLDIIFMPLVAFDDQCRRLGMGGGYYDRTMAKNHPLLIGVAYEFQRQSELIIDEWDVSMDAVITEKTIYWKKS